MRHRNFEPREQLLLPGFSTVKRLRLQQSGLLELMEFDLTEWGQHEAALDRRGRSLPRKPRANQGPTYDQWREAIEGELAKPLPIIRPIRVWQLGHFDGAPVLPWLDGQREALSTAQIDGLREYLTQHKAKRATAQADEH